MHVAHYTFWYVLAAVLLRFRKTQQNVGKTQVNGTKRVKTQGREKFEHAQILPFSAVFLQKRNKTGQNVTLRSVTQTTVTFSVTFSAVVSRNATFSHVLLRYSNTGGRRRPRLITLHFVTVTAVMTRSQTRQNVAKWDRT